MTRERGDGPHSQQRIPVSNFLTAEQIQAAKDAKATLLAGKLPRHMRLRDGFPEAFDDPEGIDREELFGPSLTQMRLLAGSYGLPLRDDLLNRLVIADLNTMVNVLLPFLPPEAIVSELNRPAAPAGFNLPGDIAVVNAWRIDMGYDPDDKADRRRREETIREEGIHQLWRLAAFKDGPMEQLASQDNFTFRAPRDGIYVRNDDAPYTTLGMFIIDQDVQNHLTKRTLEAGKLKMRKSYQLSSHTVDTLTSYVGEEQLLAAFLTEDGLPYLRDSLERSRRLFSKYQGDVLWNFARELAEPIEVVNGNSH